MMLYLLTVVGTWVFILFSFFKCTAMFYTLFCRYGTLLDNPEVGLQFFRLLYRLNCFIRHWHHEWLRTWALEADSRSKLEYSDISFMTLYKVSFISQIFAKYLSYSRYQPMYWGYNDSEDRWARITDTVFCCYTSYTLTSMTFSFVCLLVF